MVPPRPPHPAHCLLDSLLGQRCSATTVTGTPAGRATQQSSLPRNNCYCHQAGPQPTSILSQSSTMIWWHSAHGQQGTKWWLAVLGRQVGRQVGRQAGRQVGQVCAGNMRACSHALVLPPCKATACPQSENSQPAHRAWAAARRPTHANSCKLNGCADRKRTAHPSRGAARLQLLTTGQSRTGARSQPHCSSGYPASQRTRAGRQHISLDANMDGQEGGCLLVPLPEQPLCTQRGRPEGLNIENRQQSNGEQYIACRPMQPTPQWRMPHCPLQGRCPDPTTARTRLRQLVLAKHALTGTSSNSTTKEIPSCGCNALIPSAHPTRAACPRQACPQRCPTASRC